MESTKRVITRRDFIKAGAIAAGGLMGLPFISITDTHGAGSSRVVLIRSNDVVGQSGALNSDILENMLDQAVTRLLDIPDPASAWRELFTASDIVGIKSNEWGRLPTPDALEEALVRRLERAGVQPENIDVDDRGVLRNRVFKKSTALINVRPMRTHHWSGLGTLLKNYIMFVPHPWAYHGNACERLGAIWQETGVHTKTRLNILVMLTPLFHGVGPHHFSRRYIWPYGGLIVSRDPVAADATGARIIQAKRNDYFQEERPISPPPRHIAAADSRFRLGNSHPDRIQLVKLGWDEDLLI